MAFNDNSKTKAWKTHSRKLLNVEFSWNHDDLPNEPAVHCPQILITDEMACK